MEEVLTCPKCGSGNVKSPGSAGHTCSREVDERIARGELLGCDPTASIVKLRCKDCDHSFVLAYSYGSRCTIPEYRRCRWKGYALLCTRCRSEDIAYIKKDSCFECRRCDERFEFSGKIDYEEVDYQIVWDCKPGEKLLRMEFIAKIFPYRKEYEEELKKLKHGSAKWVELTMEYVQRISPFENELEQKLNELWLRHKPQAIADTSLSVEEEL